MNLIIKPIQETIYTYEDVAELMHLAFQERLDQGLEYTSSRMIASDYERRGESGIVLVAYDLDSMALVGTAMIHICKDEEGVTFGDMEHMGIMPGLKRSGIGSSLEKERTRISTLHNAAYMLSDTAFKAKSSVSWHLRNGYFKWKLVSYPSTAYYSILFRKQIKPNKKWDCPIWQRLHFWASCLHTLLIRRKNGTRRSWVSIIRK